MSDQRAAQVRLEHAAANGRGVAFGKAETEALWEAFQALVEDVWCEHCAGRHRPEHCPNVRSPAA